MLRKLIFALLFSLILVLFAVQNAGLVTINLLFWDFSISLSVILMICIFSGAIIGCLITLLSIQRKKQSIKKAEDQKAKC